MKKALLSQKDFHGKNNIPPSKSDEGAEGHGTVVFAGCFDGSMFRPKYYHSKGSEHFE